MTDDIAGILIVDKEKGMTSHDVVDVVRRKFKIKKVGHAGTLDPNATGVLVLLLGKATKLSNTFLNEDKEYEATMKLGEKTSSGDCEGEVTQTCEVSVNDSEIEETVSHFRGVIDQVPPMFSAKRVNGRKLYKLARKGIEVEREPRTITIEKLKITEINLPLVHFEVSCSKGTYIRQLAEDIGDKLGCGAHLTELRRVRSGAFTIDKAVTVTQLRKMDRQNLDENIARI